MSNKTLITALTASAALFAAGDILANTLINVDFQTRDGSDLVMSGPAALTGGTDTWNGIFNWYNGGSYTENDLNDASGNPTSADIGITGTYQDVSGYFPGVAATDAVALMAGGLLHSGPDPVDTATLTLSNLGANLDYTLVLYAQGDGASHGSEFTVVGANEGPQSTIGASATPLASPQHYVTFTGNTGGAGEIVFDWTQLQGQWSVLSGLQVELAPVPEPTSLALLGLGGLLVARRRRA